MSSEKFCLRWNDFESNISSAFRELREEKDFFDVTLACDDNQIQAHKVIISACSPFFRSVLRRNPHQHPLLYLKGVKYKELLSVLNFMYMGEVNIAQEELNSFLTVAEDLKVKGLTQGKDNTGGHRQESQTSRQEPQKTNRPKAYPKIYPDPQERATLPPPQGPQKTTRPKVYPDHQARATLPPPNSAPSLNYHQEGIEEEIQEVLPVKSEPRDLPPQPSYLPEEQHLQEQGTVALDESYTVEESYDYQYEDTGYQENAAGMGFAGDDSGGKDSSAAREDLINSHIIKDPERKLFTCTLCQFGAPSTHRVFCHLEAKHFQDSPVTYTCPYCGKAASSKNAMCLHISRNHKEEKANSSTVPFY
eukprot:GFUD01002157.1.p1 GENE.GFUD01002157.1~~GFUD01002157.1.p1  ORF type:complete len:362 (+),score=85.08 GFUD01002157.1:52-1137(+)